jgi:hypothetical protein
MVITSREMAKLTPNFNACSCARLASCCPLMPAGHDREVRKTFHRRPHSERIAGHPLANLTHQVWLFGAPLILLYSGPDALLKTGVCLGQREADNKTGTRRCLNPYVATVVENSSAGER